MKSIIFSAALLLATSLSSCEKDKEQKDDTVICTGNPRTDVSAHLQGSWMYGYFSMTEYWNQNPVEYIGNGFQYAIAFKFNANGTYEQYFTSSSVVGSTVTYQQSVTKGTVVIDEANGTIRTYACSAHYKRTRGGQTLEERDLAQSELTSTTEYSFTTGTEPNGTEAIYLQLQGTSSPLTFLQKF